MAALTKANALAEVRRLLNEPTELVFNDTEIDEWLDRGARCTSALTLCEPATEFENFEVNTIHYTLSTHFIKVRSVMYSSATGVPINGLQRMDIRWLGNAYSSTLSTPKFWYLHGDTLIIYPCPTSALAASDAGVEVYGYVVVEDYGTNGTNLPDYLNYFAVNYAVAQAYIKDGKHSKAALEMQKFMRGCMFHRRDKIDQIENVDTVDMRKIPDVTLPAQQR